MNDAILLFSTILFCAFVTYTMYECIRSVESYLDQWKESMTHTDTITLQHELRRSQFALDKCTSEQGRHLYRLYIKELASELLYRYRMMKLQQST